MKKTPARTRRGTHVESRETEADRFEFARRHVVQLQKLENTFSDAEDALWKWLHFTEEGVYIEQESAFPGPQKVRRAKTPDEREELKALQAAVVDSRARLILHQNDGFNL